MKESKHPKCDIKLLFEEAAHEYRMAAGERVDETWDEATPLPSVTQFVAHYCNEFDGEAAAAKKAERIGATPEQVKADWAAAAEMGTRVHANQEHLMRGEFPSEKPLDDRERAIMGAGWDAFQQLAAAGWEPIGAELMVFSPSYRLCGTVDAVFRRGREHLVVDWKTNRTLHSHGYLGARMKAPADTLEDCCMSKYGLQLNLYRRILLREGYVHTDMEPRMNIVHLTPDGFRVHQVEDMPEADRLLLDYLTCDWFRPQPPF